MPPTVAIDATLSDRLQASLEERFAEAGESVEQAADEAAETVEEVVEEAEEGEPVPA